MSDRVRAAAAVSVMSIAAALAAPASIAGLVRPPGVDAQQTAAPKTPPPVPTNAGELRRGAPQRVPREGGWTPPRTPDGRPDLQGIWVNNSATPLERPKALEGRPFLTDEEVAELKARADRLFDANANADAAPGDDVFLAALANVEHYTNPNATGRSAGMVRAFDNRTSLIVDPPDGRMPPLTPEARQKRAEAALGGPRPPAGPEDVSNPNRCITFGVPRLGGNAASYNPYYQIVQTPGYVVFVGETIHDARVIPLDTRPHLAPNLRSWQGDSRGRYDGNTLVVDTTNFSAKNNFMGSAERLHLVERFTRVDADTIGYEVTISDETTWTRPWTAVIRLRRTESKMYEYACHEGNFHTMSGILGAARMDDRTAEEASKRR